jgi:hypothetical protein
MRFAEHVLAREIINASGRSWVRIDLSAFVRSLRIMLFVAPKPKYPCYQICITSEA